MRKCAALARAPELDGLSFGAALAVLGIAMGLVASQLGSVMQSSVGPADLSVDSLAFTRNLPGRADSESADELAPVST